MCFSPMWKLYRTLNESTPVGYGDITTCNTTERIYVIILEIISAIMFATIIGAITSVVTNMDTNAQMRAEQLDAVASFVANRNFPEKLGKRVRRHFRFFYSRSTAIDESKILSELSTSLRKEVANFMVTELLGKESFLIHISQFLWPRLVPLLRPVMCENNEVLCTQHEHCTDLYVVVTGMLSGVCEVKGEFYPRVRHIVSGQCVNTTQGLAIWDTCVETIASSQVTETYSITVLDFIGLLSIDMSTFQRMQELELTFYKFDVSEARGSFVWGRPLYYTCYSSVEVSILQFQAPFFVPSGKEMDKNPSEKWLVVDLVNTDRANVPYTHYWRFKSNRKKPTIYTPRKGGKNHEFRRHTSDLDQSSGIAAESTHSSEVFVGNEEIFFGSAVRWSDISVPFKQVRPFRA